MGDKMLPAKVQVPMNTATILREDKLLRDKLEKEQEAIARYETEMRDSTEFLQWQQKMREKDQLEEVSRTKQRKMELQLAREEAMEASASQIRKNNMIAQSEKCVLATALTIEYKDQEFKLEAKQDHVCDVINDRGLAREAEEKVKEEKERVSSEIRSKLKKELDQKKIDDEAEMERRAEIIRQIRAYEKERDARTLAPFDPTEKPMHGLMGEMSLAELRERLCTVKQEAEDERKRIREDILLKKDDKKSDLEQKHENLKKIRKLAEVDAQLRREKAKAKKAEEERQVEMIRKEKFIEVTAKISAKQRAREAEERRIQQELKELSLRRQFEALKAGKDSTTLAIEEANRGQERYNKMRDQQAEVAAFGAKVSRVRDTKIRRANRQDVHSEFKAMQQEIEVRLVASRKDHGLRKEEVRMQNREAFEKQRGYETMLQGTRNKNYPCEAEMKQLTIAGGREFRKSPVRRGK